MSVCPALDLVVHVLKSRKSPFCLHFAVAVAHKAHGNKTENHKAGGIGEEDPVADAFHQGTGQHRRDHLGQHGGGIIITCKFSHVAAPAHFHHHGQGIHIDGRPGQPHKGKCHIHDGVHRGKQGGQKIAGDKAGRQQNNARQYGFFPSDSGGGHADGNVGNNGAGGGDQQAGGGAAQAFAHNPGDIGGEPCGDPVISDVP